MLTLCSFLQGSTIKIRTHYKTLRRLLNLADVPIRLARWRSCLAEYKYDKKPRTRVKHQMADDTSKLRTNGE